MPISRIRSTRRAEAPYSLPGARTAIRLARPSEKAEHSVLQPPLTQAREQRLLRFRDQLQKIGGLGVAKADLETQSAHQLMILPFGYKRFSFGTYTFRWRDSLFRQMEAAARSADPAKRAWAAAQIETLATLLPFGHYPLERGTVTPSKLHQMVDICEAYLEDRLQEARRLPTAPKSLVDHYGDRWGIPFVMQKIQALFHSRPAESETTQPVEFSPRATLRTRWPEILSACRRVLKTDQAILEFFTPSLYREDLGRARADFIEHESSFISCPDVPPVAQLARALRTDEFARSLALKMAAVQYGWMRRLPFGYLERTETGNALVKPSGEPGVKAGGGAKPFVLKRHTRRTPRSAEPRGSSKPPGSTESPESIDQLGTLGREHPELSFDALLGDLQGNFKLAWVREALSEHGMVGKNLRLYEASTSASPDLKAALFELALLWVHPEWHDQPGHPTREGWTFEGLERTFDTLLDQVEARTLTARESTPLAREIREHVIPYLRSERAIKRRERAEAPQEWLQQTLSALAVQHELLATQAKPIAPTESPARDQLDDLPEPEAVFSIQQRRDLNLFDEAAQTFLALGKDIAPRIEKFLVEAYINALDEKDEETRTLAVNALKQIAYVCKLLNPASGRTGLVENHSYREMEGLARAKGEEHHYFRLNVGKGTQRFFLDVMIRPNVYFDGTPSKDTVRPRAIRIRVYRGERYEDVVERQRKMDYDLSLRIEELYGAELGLSLVVNANARKRDGQPFRYQVDTTDFNSRFFVHASRAITRFQRQVLEPLIETVRARTGRP